MSHFIRRASVLFSVLFLLAVAVPVSAQTPNTATMIVVVVDQSGAVVRDAKVTVTNTATGAVREVVSGLEGAATIPALSMTGEYRVSVAKTGFTADDVTGPHASRRRDRDRQGEARGERRQERSHGLRHVRNGSRPTRRSAVSLDSETIDETPILGRKVSTLPLLNSAFRQGKGTGDLFVNATYFITGAGSRRTTTFMLDGANNDEGWGRQTMIATRADRGHAGNDRALERVFRGVRLDRRSGAEHRHQVRHECPARRGAVPGSSRELAGGDVLDQGLLPAVGVDLRRRRRRCKRSTRWTCRMSWTRCSGSIGGADGQGQDVLLRHRRLHAAGSDDVPLAHAAGVRAAGRWQSRLTRATTGRGSSTRRVDHKLTPDADADGSA